MYPDPSTYQHRNLKYYSYQCLVTAANNTPVVISVGTNIWKPWATPFIHHTPGKTYESSNEARKPQLLTGKQQVQTPKPPDVPQLAADSVLSRQQWTGRKFLRNTSIVQKDTEQVSYCDELRVWKFIKNISVTLRHNEVPACIKRQWWTLILYSFSLIHLQNRPKANR